jgi:flagellin-like protein
MQVKQLLTDDDAVSPVIGVILMVAITVILAAVIAAFVLGLGDTNNPTPNVSFDYDYNESGNNLSVTVTSGDEFDSSRVSFAGDSDEAGQNWSATDIDIGTTIVTDVTAGDDVTLTGVEADETVRIVFESEGGDTTAEIGKFEGPNA